MKKNRKRKFSQRLKAFHLLPTLLLLLSLPACLPADNAVFIHPCSFPSGHPSINWCAVGATRVSERDRGEKSSFCEKGFSLAKAGRRKAIHFVDNNNTCTTRAHLNRKPTKRNAHVGCVTESLLLLSGTAKPKAKGSFLLLSFFFFFSLWLCLFALGSVYDDR
jgi:hypothetical protein